MSEWRDLPTFEDVADAKRAGDEIELLGGIGWRKWRGSMWDRNVQYRARPAQPKMKKVRMLAYTDCQALMWRGEDVQLPSCWVRVPAEDKEIEVPE